MTLNSKLIALSLMALTISLITACGSSPESLYKKGKDYFDGNGVPVNQEKAVYFYRKAAHKGHAKAQYDLGYCYYNGIYFLEDKAEAVKWYTMASENDLEEAQFALANCYFNGEGVDQDTEEAIKWYRKAAEQGFAKAQFALGTCYYTGKGVSKNLDEAFIWNRKAAEQGFAEAQFALGSCYTLGEGVSQNKEEEVKWYRKAAEQGFAQAQFTLGACYYSGKGVSQNKEEAIKWYRKAAEQGLTDAQKALGGCYYWGEGVPQNMEEAVIWNRKAAEQGDAEAQNSLGACYYKGEGVSKDLKEAVKWFRKAAEQGHAEAQCNLGNCYARGEGVSQNMEEAVKWFRKAAEQGHAQAQLFLSSYNENSDGVSNDFNATKHGHAETTNKSKDIIDLNKELAEAGFNESPSAIQQFFMYGTYKTAQKVIKGDVFDKKEGSEEAKNFRESHSLNKNKYRLLIPVESISVPDDVEKDGIYVRFCIPFHLQYPEQFKDLTISSIKHSDTITKFDLYYQGEDYYAFREGFNDILFHEIDKDQVEEKFNSFIRTRNYFDKYNRNGDVYLLATHDKESTKTVPLVLRSVGDIELYTIFTVKDDYETLKKIARNKKSVFLEICFTNTTSFCGKNPFLAFFYQESYANLSKNGYLISAINNKFIENDYMYFIATDINEDFTFCYVKKMRILFKSESDFEEIGFIENNSKAKPEYPYTPKWINILDGEKWKAEDINE